MKDLDKTRDQLIKELNDLREKVFPSEWPVVLVDELEEEHGLSEAKKELKSAEQHIIEQNQEILEFIKSSRLFAPFSKGLIEQLLSISKFRDLPKGEKILKEGKINSEVYFLMEGEISLFSGGQHILDLRRRGDIFGERSVVSKSSCLSTVIAKTPVKVFSIKSQDIGNYTDIGSDEFRNFVFRLFAIIMTDKLSLTTDKARKYEKTQNKLLKEIEEHKQSEEKFRTVVTNSHAIIFILDLNGRFILSEGKGLELLVLKPGEVVGQSAFELYKDYPEILESIKKALKGEIVQTTLSVEEVIFDLLLTPIRNESNGIVSIAGIATDITERIKIKQALRKERERFQQVAENAQEWIWETDVDGLYTYGSPVIEKILGYKPEEIVGKKYFYDLFHPEEQEELKEVAFNVFAEKKFFKDFINRNIKKDGSEVWLSTSGVPMLDESGNLSGYRGADTNITFRKKAEEQLNASLKEKETLLKEIHHRVKNNLTVVASLLNLQANSMEDDRLKAALSDSQSRVQAMSAIHETLYQSENLSAIDMKIYLSKLGNNIARSSSIGSKVNLKVKSENISIGAKQASPIGLIVNELITNSLKYAFSNNEDGEIKINLQKVEDQIELEYSDNGIGMPEGFDWKNSKSLGLKLVRTLVENQLDGSIEMESKNGTKFIIKFNLET